MVPCPSPHSFYFPNNSPQGKYLRREPSKPIGNKPFVILPKRKLANGSGGQTMKRNKIEMG